MTTTNAEVMETMDTRELSGDEPSESGELPMSELSVEQRAERREGKRAREPATVAGTIVQVQSWSVDRIKRELDEKGLRTCGLNLVCDKNLCNPSFTH